MTGLTQQYVLPTATSSVLGGVKPDGTTLTNTAGAISVTNPATTVGTATVGQIPGTTTNDSASAGNVGEDLTAAAAGVSLTNGNALTVTSKALTAGDFLVFASFQFTGGATTTVNRLLACISTTNNTINSTAGFRGDIVPGGATSYNFGNPAIVVGPVVVKVANGQTPTYYCVAQADFGVSTTTVSAQFTAIRIR
jgi:hypothetical protein